MTCCVEVVSAATTTWVYDYNDANRLWKIRKVSGSCASPGTVNLRWTFKYDGDGIRVKEDFYNGTTLYFVVLAQQMKMINLISGSKKLSQNASEDVPFPPAVLIANPWFNFSAKTIESMDSVDAIECFTPISRMNSIR